ncbi:hypothetical protein K438DRAFT_1847893 [Mycena galopus ATCC 62051]|nr:hypothetical protein K438DRAFT_1847893 [Mycena galopus ATCC 62051]
MSPPDRYDWAELPDLRQTTIDLTALEDLEFVGCGQYDGTDAFLRFIQYFRPSRLKSLAFEDFHHERSYPVEGKEPMLLFVAPFLVNLVLEAIFPYPAENEVLPVFKALESLTIWMRPYWGHKAHVINALNALTSAPNVTTLIFRLVLDGDVKEAQREFDIILRDLPLWRTSESLKSVLARKLPRWRQVEFHFCIPRDSEIHFRRGLRRRMERQLTDELEERGAGIDGFFEFEWVDEEYNPVRYKKPNGKPPWKFRRQSRRRREPDTESSDCESQSSEASLGDSEEYDSDGNVVRRPWTEADEQAYRRGMLADR